jgi:hypothetical protein
MAVWDEQLNYIIRFLPVTVAAGEQVDIGDLGVSRWFGWLEGDVFQDDNGNGVRDPGERAIGNTDVDQRWRDGSIKESTVTDNNGHYEYPTAEGGPLGKWFIGEQGFSRFSAFPGAFVHDEYDPSIVHHVPTDLGGALLTNQLVTEGHRSIASRTLRRPATSSTRACRRTRTTSPGSRTSPCAWRTRTARCSTSTSPTTGSSRRTATASRVTSETRSAPTSAPTSTR